MTALVCPACGETGVEGASWCEACGADFAGEHAALDGPPCVDCGAEHAEIVEGYCGQCGRKQPGPRDHLVEELDGIVAVTNRGRRHHQNEDAFSIGVVGDRRIAVVCDGVSTTDNPQDASLAAANAARDSIAEALAAGQIDLEAVLAAATAEAQAAAAEIPTIPGGQGPASTTFVATIVAPDASDPTLVRTVTAWLGDSRAYWLSESPEGQVVTQLTSDDVIGQSISRWLGSDASDAVPTIQVFEHDAGGTLLVCSDGLWKYVPSEADLADRIAKYADLETPLEVAEALVGFANEQGGHDNTTIVIARS